MTLEAEVERGPRMDSSLEPSEGTQPCPHLGFRQTRVRRLACRSPSEFICAVFKARALR